MEEKFNKWKNDCSEKLKTFEILSEFKGMSKKIKLRCLICGHIFEIAPYEFKRKKTRGCKICDNNNRRKDEKKFIEELKKKNKHFNDVIIGHYHSKRTKIDVTCKICGKTHKYFPNSLMSGCWCPECKKGRLKTHDEFVLDLKKVHGKMISTASQYKDDSTKMAFKCEKCGYIWLQKPRAILNGHGCPKCKMKHLERDVQEAVKCENVEFQKQFKWLKHKGNLFLDFYLPDYNIAIECQGEQHFLPIDFSGRGKKWANENFENGILRDKIKHKLCEENDIKLFYYIPQKFQEKYHINIFDQKYNNIYTSTNILSNIKDIKKLIYGEKERFIRG